MAHIHSAQCTRKGITACSRSSNMHRGSLCCKIGTLSRQCKQGELSTRRMPTGQPRPGLALKVSTAQEVVTSVEEAMYSGESFYDILGVSPTANKKTIKKAYQAMMKEVHPDRNGSTTDEFCALLNEIYETLSDPARRATYDALSGFSLSSINPFVDTTFEKDQAYKQGFERAACRFGSGGVRLRNRSQLYHVKVFVDEFACIGCRNCCAVCPSTFAIEEEHGRARVYHQGQDPTDKQQEAIDTCPVSCIHWVTSPQLPLLEAAMARMDRVAVWSMGMGGIGGNRDVFTEASLAWQKRRSELLARRAAATTASQDSSRSNLGFNFKGFWNNAVSFEGSSGSNFYDQASKARARASAQASYDNATSGSEDEADAGMLTDKDARSIADLAARAARASRTWKVLQETVNRMKMRPQLASMSSMSSMSSVSSMDDGQMN